MKLGMVWALLVLFLALPVHANEPAASLQGSVHRDLSCPSCHSGKAETGKKMPTANCADCHPEIYEKYEASIHGRLQKEGVSGAAWCADCHGTHDILPLENTQSRIAKKNIPWTCGQCHAGVFDEYSKSVHGEAVARGNPDAPGCTDCHGEHSILPAFEALSRVYPNNIAKTTCPQCHANERIISKYNLPVGRVESFKNTYHGMASALGDVRVANCASCHGIHNILPSRDPLSRVNPANLAKTCGECHPSANDNFTQGSVHGYDRDDLPGTILKIVKGSYAFLIIAVIGGFLLHNGIDYFRKIREAYHKRLQSLYYIRMTLNERIQHGLLLGSFITLVITGFALRFGWYLPYVPAPVNVFLRSTLHRTCGALMLLVLAIHIVYCTFTRRGRNLVRAMLPKVRDFKEAGHFLLFLLGRRSEKPRFGLLTYWEKMEYWSVIWGCLIMGITGFILWFENWSLQNIPKWGLDVVTLIHYLEAILATLAVLVGHFYFVIANPDVSPMSFTWLNGRIPESIAHKEHPEAYEGRPAHIDDR